MTVNNDSENNQEEESKDDSYWKLYFEVETISMDDYRKRCRMASEYGDQQKQSTTKRLENTKKEQKSSEIEFIFDR